MVCQGILPSRLSEHLRTRGLSLTSFGRRYSKKKTDVPADKTVEANYEGGTYYFSTAQDPSQHTSVYGSSDIFALAMFQHYAPNLLAYGGTYAKNADMKIGNILPFAFPFGIRGPKMEQRVKVSLELCIQVYMRLSLGQFMEGPTILVMNQSTTGKCHTRLG
jgi:hypothetical protein